MAGEFSPLEEHFVARLAARLHRGTGPPVEVVNGGVAGYGPDQAALRLEDDIAPLRPDLVVVAVFAGNDFGDLIRNRIFHLDGAGRLVERTRVIGADLRAEFDEAERQARGSHLIRGLWDLLVRPALPPHEVLPPGGYAYLLSRRRREFQLGANGLEVAHVLGDPYDADVSLTPIRSRLATSGRSWSRSSRGSGGPPPAGRSRSFSSSSPRPTTWEKAFPIPIPPGSRTIGPRP